VYGVEKRLDELKRLLCATTAQVFAIFLSGLAIRFWLITAYPALYGGDTVLHLRNYDRLLLSYQLPGLQFLIYLTYKVTAAPLAPRLLMAMLGALAGVGFYLLLTKLMERKSAFGAALFFVVSPFLNELSIVPYQEILMLGALCFATYFYLQGQLIRASLLLAVACLTRYEAWIACPFFAYDYFRRHCYSARNALKTTCLFGSAPVLWMAFHAGLSTPGTFVLELPHSVWRFQRWLYIGWITVRNTPVICLLFAVAGILHLWKSQVLAKSGGKIFACFLAAFAIAILLSAHGEPHRTSSDPERFVTSREATLPVALVFLLAGFGLQTTLQQIFWRRIVWICAGVGVGTGVIQSASYVVQQTTRPEVQLSFQLARYLNRNIGMNQTVLLVTKPLLNEYLTFYLNKVKARGGTEGLARAQGNLKNLDLTPADFQRTAVQCRLSRTQLTASGDPHRADWMVLWSDSCPSAEVEQEVRKLQQIAIIRAGSLFATVYRR
jgi:hypothetical protein